MQSEGGAVRSSPKIAVAYSAPFVAGAAAGLTGPFTFSSHLFHPR